MHTRAAGLRRPRRSARYRTLVLLMVAGCTHQPTPYNPHDDPVTDLKPLPPTVDALLDEADVTAAYGPDGPDLSRSLRCANAILKEDRDHESAAWRAARALYFKTTQVTGKLAETLSARCMDVADVATRQGRQAESFYYAALCMGARAQAKSMEGLGLIPRMVEAGMRAKEIDPQVMHGGPDRLLGGIYLRAPAWPTSVGDLDEALSHLEQAVHLAPAWAENHLLLAEALAEDERYAEAQDALIRAKRLMQTPQADGWRKEWAQDVAKLEKKLADEAS